ncbi:MAG: hypothetical protein WC462_01055 [archaeon]
MKGQIALESLILILVVLTATILITGLYMQTHDNTMAISITREEILSQISTKKENIVIDYIKIENNLSSTDIIIKTTPLTSFNTEQIKQKIASMTKYQNPNIILK